MKLYLVQERSYACGFNGSTNDIFYLRGIYKNRKNAEKVIKKKFGEDGYVHNARITEIDSDLFDGGEL